MKGRKRSGRHAKRTRGTPNPPKRHAVGDDRLHQKKRGTGGGQDNHPLDRPQRHAIGDDRLPGS